jgi:nucleoid-associated protein EbfC
MAGSGLDDMLERAKALTDHMADMRDRLSATEVVGTSHDGTISVTMTVDAEFRDVRLAPQLLEHARHEEVEDRMLEALKDAGAQLRQMTEQRMGEVTQALSDMKF